jgi:hypothetical protein
MQKHKIGGERSELSEKIKKSEAAGKICFNIFPVSEILTVDLDTWINQPVDGILYDLNIDDATTMSCLEQDKIEWVNRRAAALVIKALKAEIEAQ